jgi:predicted transposase/invertase (TIGR01784 family)
VQRGNESSIYTAKLEGEAIGEARGEARGIKKGVLQTAKKMKSEGISVDIISKLTGLSAKEIAKL